MQASISREMYTTVTQDLKELFLPSPCSPGDAVRLMCATMHILIKNYPDAMISLVEKHYKQLIDGDWR